MNYWDKKVIREHLDKKLSSLKTFAKTPMPPQGWVKSIREALGMSASQLAKRVGIDQSRISRLENAEPSGNLKLSSLQKIAGGLNMTFVYGFVPKGTLEDMVREQAVAIALKRMRRLDHTMGLEDQALSDKQKRKAMDDMVEKIMVDRPRDFWE